MRAVTSTCHHVALWRHPSVAQQWQLNCCTAIGAVRCRSHPPSSQFTPYFRPSPPYSKVSRSPQQIVSVRDRSVLWYPPKSSTWPVPSNVKLSMLNHTRIACVPTNCSNIIHVQFSRFTRYLAVHHRRHCSFLRGDQSLADLLTCWIV